MAFYSAAGAAAGAVGAETASLMTMGLQTYAGVESAMCLGYGNWFLIGGTSGAAADVTHQGIGLLTGYQDHYSVTQTGLAFGFGGLTSMGARWLGRLLDPNGPTCFTEGTQVVVGMEYDEDGNFVSYVTMNIEDVRAGDLVYSYNTLTGETELCEVTAMFVRESDHINYLTIVDEQGHEQTIETTDGHPFWVVTDEPDLERAARDYSDGMYHGNLEVTENGYWVEAKDLRVGDVFLGVNGEISVLIDSSRVEFDENITVYNFTVDANHNYFVIADLSAFNKSASSILVHNAWYDDWAPGSNRTPELNGELHFFDHAEEFPHLQEVEEYAKLAAKARDIAMRNFDWSDGIPNTRYTAEVRRFNLKDGTYIDLEKPIPPSVTPLIISFGLQ